MVVAKGAPAEASVVNGPGCDAGRMFRDGGRDSDALLDVFGGRWGFARRSSMPQSPGCA